MSESDEESGSSGPEWPVTEEWLEEMLKEYHQTLSGNECKVQVIDFNVRPGCDAGESVLSDILATNVEYVVGNSEHISLNLIVKLLPQDPFSRFFVTEAQFDLREIKFYTKVVPDLEKFQKENLEPGQTPLSLSIPKCYHAHYAAGSVEPDHSPIPPESVLVLENIKPQGYSGVDFSRGLSLNETTAALESIGRIHALSLSIKVKEKQSLTERYPFLFQTAQATDSYQQLVERGLPQLARFLERRPGLENVLDALTKIKSNTKELIASLLAPEEPMALITHTDFWCNNLMFREEDNKTVCAILDWQMVTYSRPTNDLALLLISSVSSELRRSNIDSLLKVYWETLSASTLKFGVHIENDLGYTQQRLKNDYRRSQLLALLLCIGSVDVALGDPLTEQRLLDVLQDLYEEGVLSNDVISSAQGDCIK